MSDLVRLMLIVKSMFVEHIASVFKAKGVKETHVNDPDSMDDSRDSEG